MLKDRVQQAKKIGQEAGQNWPRVKGRKEIKKLADKPGKGWSGDQKRLAGNPGKVDEETR